MGMQATFRIVGDLVNFRDVQIGQRFYGVCGTPMCTSGLLLERTAGEQIDYRITNAVIVNPCRAILGMSKVWISCKAQVELA